MSDRGSDAGVTARRKAQSVRRLTAIAALCLAVGFLVFFLLVPKISEDSLTVLLFGESTATAFGVIGYVVPLGLLLALFFMCLRPRARTTRADVAVGIDGLREKGRALKTHRLLCPRCAPDNGNISYAEGETPISCDFVPTHSWESARSFWEELRSEGYEDAASRFATIVRNQSAA